MEVQIPVAAREQEGVLLLVAALEEVHLAAVAKVHLVVAACPVKEEVEKALNQPICSFFVVAHPHLYLVGCNTTLEPYHK